MTKTTSYAEDLAKVFYKAKMPPESRWEFIPQNAKDAYIKAMQAVIDHLEIMERGKL